MTEDSRRILRGLRGLRIPRLLRRALCLAWIVLDRAMRLLGAIARRHRRCVEAVAIACITAALVSLVPYIGRYVAVVVLCAGVLAGFWATLKTIVRD